MGIKKFIGYISRQLDGNLKECTYKSRDPRLSTGFPIHFPLVAAINGYVEENDEIEIILMHGEHEDVAEENFATFKKDLEKVQEKKNFRYTIKLIRIGEEETADVHLKAFGDLIDLFEENDRLYVCCTYGSKVIPIMEMMALNYAHRNMDNAAIECIIYGRYDHKDPAQCEIYDITSLFYMMQITNEISFASAKNSGQRVKSILQELLNIPEEE